jgi:hypothetical protein
LLVTEQTNIFPVEATLVQWQFTGRKSNKTVKWEVAREWEDVQSTENYCKVLLIQIKCAALKSL